MRCFYSSDHVTFIGGVTQAPDFTGLDETTGEPWAPAKVAQLLGLKVLADPEAIREVCTQVLAKSSSQVAEYRAGKPKLMGYLIKQVMDATSGRADPRVTQQVLKELLS